MVRLRLRGLAGVLATAFFVMPASAAIASPVEEGADMFRPSGREPAPAPFTSEIWVVAALSAQEWLDTIRPPLRDDGPEKACPGIGGIAFDPGTAEPSGDGRRSLDALAKTLSSQALADSRFRILWLANAGASGGLADRRARKIEADLRSGQALLPGRLEMMPASAVFEDCSRPVPPDTLLLKVGIAGRWWGGQ